MQSGRRYGLKGRILYRYEPQSMDTVIASQASTEITPDGMDMLQSEKENTSVEEVRELILGILMDYISMKRKLNRLVNVYIEYIIKQALDVSGVVAQLVFLIKVYPALMDGSTTEKIMALLRMNSDKQEIEVIKEVLKIN